MAAAGAVCPADISQEMAEVDAEAAGALHERLVAYVHSLEHTSRRGVWGEHSYARARGEGRGGSAGGGGRSRIMLAPRAPSPSEGELDVGLPASPPRRPADDGEPADAEDWEARLVALAPSPAHARLAAAVAAALRRMRLERLARGGGGAEARTAARGLRRALAPLWLAGGGRAAPAWLRAALAACLPRGARRLYEEALAELRRAVPRLAERLGGAGGAAPAPRPPPALPAAPPRAEPWLVWVSGGAAADARWERRLGALLPTRVLRAGRGAAGGAAPPEPWCAGAAGAVRAQLTDALAEAGDRSVILGGFGAGAALCLLLARGAGGAERAAGGVRGAVLVAPPLRTAEGGRGAGDDALRAVRLPLLLVRGTRAHDAPRHIAHDVCALGGAEGVGARRLLEVSGADSALRLTRRARARLRLTQDALDAALAEECVRWAVDTAEGEEPPPSPPTAPSPPRRGAPPALVHQLEPDDSADYAHLPAASASASAAASASKSVRSIEIVERRPPGPPGPPDPPAPALPSPADIMQMPIVFADDNATESGSSTGSPVTVTSGKARGAGAAPPVKMTRVILAKRAPPPASPASPAPSAPAPAAPAPRRLLVRRGMRLVTRHKP